MTAPRLSVVINNYNYGRFLAQAVESALAQTYAQTEIIVIDDGSTDHSREVIASFGDRVVAVLKANGGHGSALNAGFARSTGDVVLFLDADDMLLPDTGARVLAAFARQAEAAKVHYPLEVVEEDGAPTGRLEPPRPLMAGDLRQHVLKYYSYSSPPTSGNAFPRRVLDRLLPMPEEPYRMAAETYLTDLTPLLGPIVGLPEAGALYRRHGTNHFNIGQINERYLSFLRGDILRYAEGRKHQRRLAQELGLPPPEDAEGLAVTVRRLISLKLDPARHPLAGDTLWRAARQGVAAALGPNYFGGQSSRLLHAGWFLAVAAAPRSVAEYLILQYCFPETRGRAARLIRRPGSPTDDDRGPVHDELCKLLYR